MASHNTSSIPLSPLQGINHWLNDPVHKTQLNIIFIAFFIGLTYFLFSPNLDANWWIIDDHEIMQYSPKDHPLSFSEIIPTLLTKTEINPSATIPRFRPVYYLFRLIETRIWHSVGPEGWYLARMIAFAIMLITLFLFFSKVNGQIIGFLLTLQISTFNIWPDIFSRLGPSEAYCVLGVALFLVGTYLILSGKTKGISWLLLLMGTLIAVGSKEPMVVILVAYALVLFFHLQKKPENRLFPIITFGLSILWTGWIYFVIYKRISLSLSDMYGNSITASTRIPLVIESIGKQWFLFGLLAIVVLLSILGWIIVKSDVGKQLYRILTFCTLGIAALLISQKYFYAGVSVSRYHYPILLGVPLFVSLLHYGFAKLEIELFRRSKFYVTNLLTSVILITVFIDPSSWVRTNEASKVNANRTNYFMSIVGSAETYLHADSKISLVLYGNDPGSDFETSASYAKFLRSMSIPNPIYILRDPGIDFKTKLTNLELTLETELIIFSSEGNPDWGINPAGDFFSHPTNCLLLTLNVDHPAPVHCTDTLNGDVMIHYDGLYRRWE